MPPKKHPKVDYLRVYPGLNDFSDALEAIPIDLVPYFTQLKEIEVKFNDVTPQLRSGIDGFFKTRDKAQLAEVSDLLVEFSPAVEQKMHLATLAADAMARQIERLKTDYQMACEHEIPEEIQLDLNDRAFMQIVPPEKQTTARSQARREAREAREARRVAQQESRAGTPLNGAMEPGPSSSRRRTGTPQSPQPAATATTSAVVSHQAAHAGDPRVPSPAQAPPPVQPVEAAAAAVAVPPPVQPVPPVQPRQELRHEGRQLRRHTAEDGGDDSGTPKLESGAAVPPVVMPITQTVESAMTAKINGDDEADIETAAAEAVSGLKRKRGTLPKDARNEPTYCYCQQGSYGEMVACDGPNCQREWFHLGCLGLSALPKGQWFCKECQAKFRRR